MNTPSFTTTFSVNHTLEAVFDAINNVRGWWSGMLINGNSRKLIATGERQPDAFA